MRRTAALGAVLAVLAVGCTGGATEPADEADGGVAEAPGTSPATVDPRDQVETVDTEADERAEAPVPALLRTEPLATAAHPLTDLDGTLDIELRAQEVGDLLRVALTFTPRGIEEGKTSIAELLGAYASGDGISGRLIDPVNLLEYETVKPAVRHGQAAPAYVDHPTTLVFYFGTPVEPMETFDFLLDFEVGAPHWPGFVDVPIELA